MPRDLLILLDREASALISDTKGARGQVTQYPSYQGAESQKGSMHTLTEYMTPYNVPTGNCSTRMNYFCHVIKLVPAGFITRNVDSQSLYVAERVTRS